MSSESRFDDILGAAKQGQKQEQPQQVKQGKGRSQPKPEQKSTGPWADLEPPEREATVRLNVDIPISLNDKLAEKARQLRKPKTELVRRLLKWALNESID